MPEPAEPKRFFVVWSPQGGPPVARYPTFNAARTAALRLSTKHTSQDFFVLQSCWGKLAEPAVEGVDEEASVHESEASP